MCTLHLTLSTYEFECSSILIHKSNSNNGVLPALHDSCGWPAYVLFLTHYLDACEQISLGNSWSSKYLIFEICFEDMIFSLNA
jgi:hypothetical protein